MWKRRSFSNIESEERGHICSLSLSLSLSRCSSCISCPLSVSLYLLLFSKMNCAFDNLDAAGFLQIWQHFDADGENKIFPFCLQLFTVLLHMYRFQYWFNNAFSIYPFMNLRNTFRQIMATLKGKSWMTSSGTCWKNLGQRYVKKNKKLNFCVLFKQCKVKTMV